MELRHLRYFVVVAEELNFSRAAERLHIAQPPLSQQIRSLEEELGLRLFHRTKRKVSLTDGGRDFLVNARHTLAQAEHAIRSAQRASRGQVGRLVVGFVMSATCSIVPKILRIFQSHSPDVELVLQESTSSESLAALCEQRMHIGFLRMPFNANSLKYACVLKEPYMVALPGSHPLSKRAKIKVHMLANEHFIISPRSQGPGYYDQIINMCHRAGFSPHIAQEAKQFQTTLSLVSAGMGVAVIPASVKDLRSLEIVYKPLDPPDQYSEIAVAWKSDNISPLVSAFLDVARQVSRSYHQNNGDSATSKVVVSK